ncbi:MAG TPA: ABC transporter substrate-binding protein [Ktedonobacterales bacterium]|nr:ABC transporter substrate-binding protein [Ktedonobacterales bacterium]
MISWSPSRTRILALACGFSALLAMLLSACGATTAIGGGGKPTPSSATPTVVPVTCPAASVVATWHLVNAGQLTIASDTTYAPAEFPDAKDPSKFIGYDMDLAREFARRLCLNPNIQKATFGNIIPDISGAPLGQQRYDMSISSFTINTDRLKKVDMIPYFTAGESILTLTANPANIKSINDMCGKIIAVQNGTVEQQEVQDANGGNNNSGQAPVCKTANKLITIVSNDDQGIVVDQVLNGRADASYQDQPVTDYYASLHPGKLIDAGITVQPSPEGIVMRKDNAALESAITSALQAMRTDGTYLTILKAWGQQSLAYPPL